MIRVLHARTGETLRHARARRPAIEAATVQELLQRLRDPESWNGLDPAEVEAVRQAAASIASREPVNILVAGGGSIFRIEKPDPGLLAEQAALHAEPVPWLAVERAALVLVVCPPHDVHAERVAEAVRFVGYDSELLVAPALPAIADRIASRAPLAVVVQAALVAGTGDLVDAARRGWKSHGFVTLAREEAPAPPGIDGTLRLPLRLDAIARVLDPLISQARTQRAPL